MKKEYKGYIAVDFDAVLATYDRPFVYNKLGSSNKEVIETINHFYKMGYYVYIFTGRLETPKIINWLKNNNVKYHSFNRCIKNYPNESKAKPYYDVLIDDKAVNYHFRNNPKTKDELIEDITKILNRHKK